MNHLRMTTPASAAQGEKRATDRQPAVLPARLTWKDQRGATRFATVITRDVSEFGVFVECLSSAVSIPMYRLVHFQLERDVRQSDSLPSSFRQGRILSAVYRVTPPTASGKLQGVALRLMIDPKRRADDVEPARATA